VGDALQRRLGVSPSTRQTLPATALAGRAGVAMAAAAALAAVIVGVPLAAPVRAATSAANPPAAVGLKAYVYSGTGYTFTEGAGPTRSTCCMGAWSGSFPLLSGERSAPAVAAGHPACCTTRSLSRTADGIRRVELPQRLAERMGYQFVRGERMHHGMDGRVDPVHAQHGAGGPAVRRLQRQCRAAGPGHADHQAWLASKHSFGK
jgi:hypothetical protein